MTGLQTTYLGLTLDNPLVASAGPLTQTVDGFRELNEAGVGAIVMYSLFEEQLRLEASRDALMAEEFSESYAESLSFLPTVPSTDSGLSHRYLDVLRRGVEAVDVPVIASLNGSTEGGWTEFAKQMEDAGASAIELNIYLVPGDVTVSGREVEDHHIRILEGVKQSVGIPVAVKMSPYFSSIGEMALRLVNAGADGLVLFNRFLQPEIDIESMSVESDMELSTSVEGRVPRTWIAALRGRVQGASIAATSGVERADDVVRYLLAGADVAMTTSALVRHGALYAEKLLDGLENWMSRKGFDSVDEFRGALAVPSDADGTAFGRQGYVSALEKAKKIYGQV